VRQFSDIPFSVFEVFHPMLDNAGLHPGIHMDMKKSEQFAAELCFLQGI
jgi:hypothetical protein